MLVMSHTTCHAPIVVSSASSGLWRVAVSPARDSRGKCTNPLSLTQNWTGLDWMAPSERLEQITNHLSNNYTRGLLNGDVAIITGNLFSSAPALRFSFDDVPVTNQYLISSPQALRRCVKGTIWPHNNPSELKTRSLA